jgi:hypothetical protein
MSAPNPEAETVQFCFLNGKTGADGISNCPLLPEKKGSVAVASPLTVQITSLGYFKSKLDKSFEILFFCLSTWNPLRG